MKNINFHLEKRKDKLSGELISYNVPIFLDFNFNGKRLQYYTGLRIDANKWDDGLERTKEGKVSRFRIHPGRAKKNTSGASDINSQLNAIIAKINEIYETAKALKIPITVEYLRNELKDDPSKKRSVNVFTAFEQFIVERETKDAETTLKKYKSTRNHFEKYCGKKKNLEFQDLNIGFLEKFKIYLINEADHTHNTVVKYIKTLKAFIKWADDRNYNPNADYRKLKIEGEKVPAIIFLTWKELIHLYNLKIKGETLRQVRDVFCFGCFTGQRYSDIANLKPQHIVDKIWINAPIKSHKAQPLYIPLTDFALTILERYKDLPSGKALPIISNQKMNEYLKDLGELAKIDTPVTIYRFKGAKRIETTIPKWKIMTTHIMRKTFVSNALSFGMQTATIKEFTGHKTDKDFNRYLAVITEDKIKAMDVFNKAK
ncbi:MAG TPA: site-specific integrase [Bacteroidia bacterium]|jgi:integrase|nr:site-specific integrase [Bacteroidia bacterium]